MWRPLSPAGGMETQIVHHSLRIIRMIIGLDSEEEGECNSNNTNYLEHSFIIMYLF